MGCYSWLVVAFATIAVTAGKLLTPPYFNLAEGKSITATATCGVNITTPKERFCRLTGASADEIKYFISSSRSYYSGNSQIIAGQLCDFCAADGTPEGKALPSQVHSAKFAIDGTERWWQSPPLSRGSHFNDVNLTIDLGQEFHVAYVFIKMGNSPRPGVWSLDKSTDHGKTWTTWQYFADSRADCQLFFKQSASKKPTSDNDVICTTEFSKIVPLEGGEIAVSLVQDRPGSTNFSHAPALQAFTKATNVRLSLQRTKTLQGHLMQLQRQDPTVTRRYFYSVKDISIGGRCVCNGHAEACEKKDQFKLVCECQHNTCGDNCNSCCEGFVQKKWQAATKSDPNACEPCQCYGHSTECEYDEDIDRRGLSIDIRSKYEGGGVCKNCTDNTRGINCDQCIHGFYRPVGKSLYDRDACQPCVCDPKFTTGDCQDKTGICECLPQFTGLNCQECAFGYYGPPTCKKCDCFLNGTLGAVCEVGGGQCPCKANFSSKTCGECADGYWNYPECTPCSCGGAGAANAVCNKMTGQCNCNFAFNGTECDKCQVGYFDYPKCGFCNCDTTGTKASICDANSGQCLCKDNYTGTRCGQCAASFYSYPECRACQCDTTGTVQGSTLCNGQGQCACLPNFGGKKCDACAPGYHNYPNCKSCDCNLQGSFGKSCDQTSAQCECRQHFVGLKCSSCAPDYYNFPRCEACLCNPAGAMPVKGYPLGGCGSFNDGYKLCECKANVEGHTCDQCKPGYYDLTKDNTEGCKPCTCHLPGTLLGDNMCDPTTGQCLCKVNVNSEWCQACIAGTYDLQESSVFGCEDCNCDMGGAISRVCNDQNGQCSCRRAIKGRQCNKPFDTYYFPTLHQYKYELEDGYNPTDDDSAVRFGFNTKDFPGFSWRGYAVFSRIQPEVRVIVNIEKPSLFRLIFRFMNRNFATVEAEVAVTPDDPGDQKQTATVKFPSTGSLEPEFLTTGTSLVLSKGKWTISVKTDVALDVRSDHMFVDYLVLLPQAYYEGSVLQDRLKNPCMVPSDGKDCLHYTYLDLSPFNQQDGGDAVRPDGAEPTMETNRDILLPLNSPALAELDKGQPTLVFNMTLKEPGKYVVVIGYTSPLKKRQTVTVTMKPEGENATVGKAMIYECEYSSLCRQVVIDMDRGPQLLDTQTVNVTVTISSADGTIASIGYISAVPEDKWEDEMVKAKIMCVQVKGKCVKSEYPSIPGSIKTDVTLNANTTTVPALGDKKLVKLDTTNTLVVPFTDVTSQSYAVVASYYQPDNVGFPVNVTVDVNGVMYTGYFDASYCPNTAGCNSIVTFDDILIQNQIIEVLSKDAMIKIKPLTNEKANVYLDVIQMVPTQDVKTLMSHFELLDPYDLSSRYISECTGKNFHIDPEKGQITRFCRSSIFSVTTEYNDGALPCSCNAQGSEAFRCSEFGGQCRCKPNVIGRTCNACAQNYFGFPNCKPCKCPATCNAVTGDCECPKRVTGPLCDQCANKTFGYDRTIGCMDCKCEPKGVLNNNLDCDLDTGACDCKPSVERRKCDVCIAGHWNYPSCDACNCDPAGTTETICDPETSQCSCKANTGGATCGECQSGTYNLESRNHEGCTKCFCFGITSTCRPSNLLRSEIRNMSGWGLTNVNGTIDVTAMNDMVMANLDNSSHVQRIAMYWLAPETYLGNRLTSYGGQIKYRVSNFGISRGDRPKDTRLPGPDIQISGKGLVITYSLLSPILDEEIAVNIIERSWRHAKSGDLVTREQLMKVLSSVDEVLLKANHYINVPEVSLSKVTLDSAVELDPTSSNTTSGVSQSFSSDIALTVEMCQCPPNYAGTSCEDCADGFYRKINDQGDFVCIPCECNGHSGTCDRETGVCSGCQGNTEGDHCGKCKFGYTGEPKDGKDCIICACPMPIESNNFAKDCVMSPVNSLQTIQCDCMPGFLPPFCDSCGPGHFGNPRNTSGGNCIPCDCNGNTDQSDPGSCDNSVGSCLRCLNNTQGDNCEECKDFYWGDAINAKDCQKCDCDELGTESCDKGTGNCMCKPNVVGDRCDQCANNTWGFLSGNGCSFCNCSMAANGTQCDIATGDCMCQPGVTGKMCSSCLPQHWDFTAQGCKSCNCERDGAVGCSVETGICQCLKGVTGPKCDRCDDRWVLIPDQGCEPCDNCVHTLLDDTDGLQFDIANASSSLYIINIGVEARKRLELLNLTTQAIKMALENVPKRSLDSDEMDGLIGNLTAVTELANEALKKARQVETTSDEATRSYKELTGNLVKARTSKDDALRQLEDVLNYIRKRYDDILNSPELRDVSKLLKEALRMLADMQERQLEFDDLLDDARSANESAQATLDEVEKWNLESISILDQFILISKSLNDTKSRLQDLQEKAKNALERSDTAEKQLDSLKALIANLQKNTEAIKALRDMLEKTIEDADKLSVEAGDYIKNATDTFKKLEEDLTVLEQMVERLNSLYNTLSEGNVKARPKVDAAIEHADNLKVQAADLSSLLNEASEAALKAANAYKMIVTSIHEAMNASRDALDVAMKATQKLDTGVCCGDSTDIHNNTEQVRADSLEQLTEAQRLKNETSQDLQKRLETSISTLRGLNVQNRNNEQKHSEVVFNLTPIRQNNAEEAKEARKLANESLTLAKDAISSVQPILETLDLDEHMVKQIPTLQHQMNVKLLKIKAKMETINNIFPNVTSLTERLTKKVPKLEESREKLKTSLSALRQRIDTARATANRIKVAIKSDENMTVELRAPEGFVDSLSQQTELSLFFQTVEEDGLLLYIGPKATSSDTRPKRGATVVEYLAIELMAGHVVWKYNLGAITANITSARKYNDGKWHQVIAKRQGAEGELAVKTHNKDTDVTNGSAGGFYSQLDLVPKATRIFAGGVPDNFSLPDQVMKKTFIGGLDDYSYAESRIRLGLWNFVDGRSNDKGILDRGDELAAEVSDSVRFVAASESFITINKGSLSASKSFGISLKFATLNKNGIIFFMGQDIKTKFVPRPDYFKLYIVNGQVQATIELGGGAFTVIYEDKYVADGKEHTVSVRRKDNAISLNVDNDEAIVKYGSTSSKELNLGSNPELHIGGIPKDSQYYGKKEVSHPYFDGCVSDLILKSIKKNIVADYVAKAGTVPGCKLVKYRVTFKDDDGTDSSKAEGFVHIVDDVVMIGDEFQLVMRIKTVAENGVLFYASSQDDRSAFSVALVEGKIKVLNTAGPDSSGVARRNDVETTKKYNDGRWHYINVQKKALTLTLFVDDNDRTMKDGKHRGKKTKTEPTFGYFLGGIRPGTVKAITYKENSPTWQRFIGCMSAVSIQQIVVDFAVSTPQGPFADYSACPVADPVDPDAITTTPVPVPTPPMDAKVTAPPPAVCLLPPEPNVKGVVEQGTRFGLAENSRFEFTTIAGFQTDIRSKLRLNNNLRFLVKTYATEGMIWLVGNVGDNPDYSAIYLDRGKVVYKCNLGSGPGTGISAGTINDGKWHTVEVMRRRVDKVLTGSLTIDKGTPVAITWPGKATSLNFALPIYVGGVDMADERYTYMAEKIGATSAGSLVGCIDKIEYRGKDASSKWRPYGKENKAISTQGCFENQEDGAFIPKSEAFLALGDGTKIGMNAEVEVSVRPRSSSGVILLVWGGGDYLGIELYEGKVKANVNNGAGDIETSVSVPDICDGKWRKIKVVKKRNALTLMVALETDAEFSSELQSTFSGGAFDITSADTNSPVYIGGVPKETAGVRYAHKSGASDYVGCIRSVRVGLTNYNISRGRKIGEVERTCPTT